MDTWVGMGFFFACSARPLHLSAVTGKGRGEDTITPVFPMGTFWSFTKDAQQGFTLLSPRSCECWMHRWGFRGFYCLCGLDRMACMPIMVTVASSLGSAHMPLASAHWDKTFRPSCSRVRILSLSMSHGPSAGIGALQTTSRGRMSVGSR